MFCAVQENYWKVVESLVDNAADVNVRRKNGPTPLYIAAQEGYDKLVTKLIECKGLPDCRALVCCNTCQSKTILNKFGER